MTAQWMWYPPLMIGIFFAPESPWWLVRQGRITDAKKSLLRLVSTKKNPDYNPDETIDMIRHTTELEQDMTAGASYKDCFKGPSYEPSLITIRWIRWGRGGADLVGTNLRRTEIVCAIWATQNLSGK